MSELDILIERNKIYKNAIDNNLCPPSGRIPLKRRMELLRFQIRNEEIKLRKEKIIAIINS